MVSLINWRSNQRSCYKMQNISIIQICKQWFFLSYCQITEIHGIRPIDICSGVLSSCIGEGNGLKKYLLNISNLLTL